MIDNKKARKESLVLILIKNILVSEIILFVVVLVFLLSLICSNIVDTCPNLIDLLILFQFVIINDNTLDMALDIVGSISFISGGVILTIGICIMYSPDIRSYGAMGHAFSLRDVGKVEHRKGVDWLFHSYNVLISGAVLVVQGILISLVY